MITNHLKFTVLPLMVLFCFSHSFTAQANGQPDDFMLGFIVGEYQLIGKSLNSDDTYLGHIAFSQSKENIIFVKTINNVSTKGSVTIEKTEADKVKVLRLRFEADSIQYEETCLISTDLDNYARFTCHLYQKDVPTDNPGLEALFIKK